MNLPVLVAAVMLSVGITVAGGTGWTTLNGCRLNAAAYADGDSFHVIHNGKDYVFRLYFVDAPETDTRHADRLREQAKHFGIPRSRVPDAGNLATGFTKNALRSPFTVITKWEDARGESRQPRFFAIVRTRAGDLAELLVTNGWARVYGVDPGYPTPAKAKAFRERLKQLESTAKDAKKGVWGMSSKKTPAKAADTAREKPAPSNPAGESINDGIFNQLRELIEEQSR